jgi:hypothetical protein
MDTEIMTLERELPRLWIRYFQSPPFMFLWYNYLLYAGFLLDLHLNREDKGDMFSETSINF